jgi:hypothetical protein
MYSKSIITGAVILIVLGHQAVSQNEHSLDDFRWKNRLLFIFEENLSVEEKTKLTSLLTNDVGEIKDRDLIIFTVANKVESFPVEVSLSLTPQVIGDRFVKAQEKLILIGKDGGVKLRSNNQLLSLNEVFECIDAMPMRIREMQDQ